MIIDRKIGVAPRIAAIAFVAILAGCSSAPDKADDPSKIAYAICLEYGSEDRMPCKGLQLPNPASQLAYGMCLEYHPKDAAPCNRLRDAYRADLRAYLESLKAAAGADPAKAGQGPRLDPRRAIELHHTARRALQGNQQRCRHLRRRALGRGDAPSRRRRPGPDAVRSGIARSPTSREPKPSTGTNTCRGLSGLIRKACVAARRVNRSRPRRYPRVIRRRSS